MQPLSLVSITIAGNYFAYSKIFGFEERNEDKKPTKWSLMLSIQHLLNNYRKLKAHTAYIIQT